MSNICVSWRILCLVLLVVIQVSCAIVEDTPTNNAPLERTKRSPFLGKLLGIGGSFDVGLGGFFDASLGTGVSSNQGYGYRSGYGNGYGGGYGRSYNGGGYSTGYGSGSGGGYNAGYYRPNTGYSYNQGYNNGDRYATSYQTGYQQAAQPNYIILVAQPATSVNYATAQAPVQTQAAPNTWSYASSQASSQSSSYYNTNYGSNNDNSPAVAADCT